MMLFLLAAVILVWSIASPVLASSDTSAENQAETQTDTEEQTEAETEEESEPETEAPLEFESIAETALLMEFSTGKILYEKNADVPMPPASITKIMTLLLGFEAIERGEADWDDMVLVSEKAWRETGSVMFLLVDTQVPLRDIITGISVVSANDGCVALAEHLNGTVESFVRLMNNRAKELGLTNTQFKNPHGLPAEGHYMSARDIAVLARYLIDKFPEILEIESTREFTFNDVLQFNRNPLLGVYPGADGLKTGRTDEAGYCLVGTAMQNGMRMISVVLRTESDEERLAASRELLDYGFHNFEFAEAVSEGDIVGEVNIKSGKDLTVPIKIDQSATVLIPKGRDGDIKVSLSVKDDPIFAPVEAETEIGEAEIRLDDELLATVKISTAKGVEKAGFFELIWREIVNFFKSLFQISTEG
jgi:D-alanyl-D-alanine carboxypeptidase (penicillin-binding protein 5/6)